MAVTIHFLKRDNHGNLIMVSRLLAFRFIEGTHTGENLAQNFFGILKSYGILKSVRTPAILILLQPQSKTYFTDWNDYTRQC